MLIENLATSADISRVLGEVDPLIASRILAIAPTVDELVEAARGVQDEQGFSEEPHSPSSERVSSLRAIIAELAEQDEADQEPAMPAQEAP